MDSFLKSDRGSRLVLFLFNLFRSDLQFFCFRLRRLEGHGLLPRGERPRRKPSSHSRRKIQ